LFGGGMNNLNDRGNFFSTESPDVDSAEILYLFLPYLFFYLYYEHPDPIQETRMGQRVIKSDFKCGSIAFRLGLFFLLDQKEPLEELKNQGCE
jgi:hypothetical protein